MCALVCQEPHITIHVCSQSLLTKTVSRSTKLNVLSKIKITHKLHLLFYLSQVDAVGDKVDTEKIINSLMDENFPSLTLTDQFTYHKSGELVQQHNSVISLFSYKSLYVYTIYPLLIK